MIDGMDLDHVPLCKALRQSKCHDGARPQHRLLGSYISVAARFAPVHTREHACCLAATCEYVTHASLPVCGHLVPPLRSTSYLFPPPPPPPTLGLSSLLLPCPVLSSPPPPCPRHPLLAHILPPLPPLPCPSSRRRATALRPHDARMWCALGQCYVSEQLGLQEQAIRCYRRAIQYNDPDGIAAHMLVGREAQEPGSVEDGEGTPGMGGLGACWGTLIKKTSEWAGAWGTVGRAYKPLLPLTGEGWRIDAEGGGLLIGAASLCPCTQQAPRHAWYAGQAVRGTAGLRSCRAASPLYAVALGASRPAPWR